MNITITKKVTSVKSNHDVYAIIRIINGVKDE